MSNNQLKTIDPKALENTTGGGEPGTRGNGGVGGGLDGILKGPGGPLDNPLGPPFGPKRPRPCMACGMG